MAWRSRRIAMTIPQLAAAAVALMVLSAGSVWLALPGARGSDGAPPAVTADAAEAVDAPGVAGSSPDGVAGAPQPQVALTAAYDAAISQLEVEFDRRRDQLNPETIRVVEQNLAIIDGAIAEAGNALAGDPASTFLNTHLASAMKRKVDLLRRVTSIERTES